MDESILAHVDLFSTLDAKELPVIAKGCQERSYPAGTPLFKQGDTGVGLYVIESGKVHISRVDNPDRPEEDLGIVGPGDVIGEMALLDDFPRSATATAVEDVTALVLPIWDFRAVLRDHPDIALNLLGVLSRRLRKAEARQRI